MAITLDEWKEWKLHPVTIEFFSSVKARIEDKKDQWANGNFTEETIDGTSQRNAEAIGAVVALSDLLETSYEGVIEEVADAKYNK